jgi:hypothetical protein
MHVSDVVISGTANFMIGRSKQTIRGSRERPPGVRPLSLACRAKKGIALIIKDPSIHPGVQLNSLGL